MRPLARALAPGLLLFACAKPEESLLRTVEVAGCRELRPGRVCEIEEPTPLTLWVSAAHDARLTLKIDGSVHPAEWTPVQGGRRVKLVATPTTAVVELVAERKGIDRWALRIEHHPRTARIVDGERLYRAGQSEEAERRLAPAKTSTNVREAIDAERLLGGIAARRGDYAEAEKRWLKASDQAAAANLPLRAANERLSAAFLGIHETRDLAGARRLLDQVEASMSPEDATGRVHVQFYQGMVAARSGDLRRGVAQLEAAERAAQRLAVDRSWFMAAQSRAEILTSLGLDAEALALIEQLRSHPLALGSPCTQATLAISSVWAVVLVREQGGGRRLPNGGEALRAVSRLENECGDRYHARLLLLNLALSALQEGDLAGARSLLARADGLGVSDVPLQLLWSVDLEARIALAEGRIPAARKAGERLLSLARQAGLREAEWRALVGLGAAFQAAKQDRLALAAFEEARTVLRQESAAVTFGGLRSHFLASRRKAAQLEAALRLSRGEPAEAAEVMRRSRLEGLRDLALSLRLSALDAASRARWQAAVSKHAQIQAHLDEALSSAWGRARSATGVAEERHVAERERLAVLDEALGGLAAPESEAAESKAVAQERELVLGLFPLSGNGLGDDDTWLVAAWSDRGVWALDLGRMPPERTASALGDWLLRPLDAELRRARRVRVLVEGAAQRIDVHALLWAGRPLAESHAVRYALDLAQDVRGSTTARPRSAMIAADPLGDLPLARDEARRVEVELAKRGYAIERLEGARVTRGALASARVGLLHYSGHARYEDGGSFGLNAAIPLADGTLWTASDVLASAAVPERVVLAGCDTARTPRLAGVQLGLAQALVIAGAQEVLAATRPVPDSLASELGVRVSSDSRSLDEALSGALDAGVGRQADWAAFRVFVP